MVVSLSQKRIRGEIEVLGDIGASSQGVGACPPMRKPPQSLKLETVSKNVLFLGVLQLAADARINIYSPQNRAAAWWAPPLRRLAEKVFRSP
eukprot:226338-Amphidinium_carterae.1